MIYQYMHFCYADFLPDIVLIIGLMTINVLIAVLNLFFVNLGIVLEYWNSDGISEDLFLNVTQFSILVEGFKTLKQGYLT